MCPTPIRAGVHCQFTEPLQDITNIIPPVEDWQRFPQVDPDFDISSPFELTVAGKDYWLEKREVPPFCDERNHWLIVQIHFTDDDNYVRHYCTRCYDSVKADWLCERRTSEAAAEVAEVWDFHSVCLEFAGEDWQDEFDTDEHFCENCADLCIHIATNSANLCVVHNQQAEDRDRWLSYQTIVYMNLINYNVSRHRSLPQWLTS